MNLKSMFFVFLSVLLFLQIEEVTAQKNEQKLRGEEISITIDSIINKLQVNYVFPDVADEMSESIRKYLKEGKYPSSLNPTGFARQITKDLQAISKDKHLMVVYDPQIIARERSLTDEDRANEESEWIKQLLKDLKRDNYGFREVKILEGNIGYMNLREFVDPKYGGETLAAVMHLLSNTNAIIIDLRQNDGGSPLMVQLLASYFFPSEPVHLADHYNRPRDELMQFWTLPHVQGIRRPEVELYILTSDKTFSAAEAFSYQMKHLGRATIIGEKTSGGAHLTGSVIATDKFYVRIPQGRTTSSVTNTDWEGIGVIPHIEVSAELALETAHSKARGN